MSISRIIELLKSLTKPNLNDAGAVLDEVKVVFVPPILHIDAVSAIFDDIDIEARIGELEKLLAIENNGSPVFLERLISRLPISINALTREEAEAKSKWVRLGRNSTWVSSFLGDVAKHENLSQQCKPQFVHFYGYKGGQGRSTVLAMLAKALADDGYRVLLVDADIEAPSLDLLFGVSADQFSQTLMGLCGWAESLSPIAGAYTGVSQGRIDLVPCRPRVVGADLDFALLAANAPLDTRLFESAAGKLKESLASRTDEYDVVLVDHRTGMASSVLPLISSLPGGAVIFARTDFNTAAIPSELRYVVRSIFSNTSVVPGVFCSFSLDPNRAATAAASPTEARMREELLSELAAAIQTSNDGATAEDLSLNWIDWYLDRALLEPSLPIVSKLQADNIRSLNLLREVLALPLGRRRNLAGAASPIVIDSPSNDIASVSGAKDFGKFIHTPEVERLFISGNPYSYVLGRKGTGKTRIVRELYARRLGLPLLVAADAEASLALQSQSIEAQAWLEKCKFDAPTFWWSLLRVALARPAGVSIAQLISEYISKGIEPSELADRLKIKSLIVSLPEPQVFLVDGLETLVPAVNIKRFVGALFDLMGAVQNDGALSSKITIRVFVREDLASDSLQNVEQQMEGRKVILKWSAVSILNFAISRIPTLNWIKIKFPEVCEDIDRQWGLVERGAMSEQSATELLLRIFPQRLRRNNLSTATFLRLYFSDAGGDDTNKATFYPRLYLSFLKKLDDLAAITSKPVDSEGRIISSLLNQAYDDASGEFISETKQELLHLLFLEYKDHGIGEHETDQEKVAKFIAAFDGLSTPFDYEALVDKLCEKTKFNEKSVRESLQRMKSIRMFENRPGYAGWWRVGQLYKMGLNMKYSR
ncbi:tyrosine-protein kinase family protein [Sphaerotilus uruguayifluvii]|uniref:AAA domain-containing protein n=1 Tax=Sphaerotilus uruguayifluvii TaxID=2735897 RepID=A0ABX2G742_9BURK|nr:AAA family ATPase [Leptothrix sp. C29]NRT58141.1 hypothetical protein [Leptothrix sp. C29]